MIKEEKNKDNININLNVSLYILSNKKYLKYFFIYKNL